MTQPLDFNEEVKKLSEKYWAERVGHTFAENSVLFRTALINLAIKIGGSHTIAARMLGIPKASLYSKMKTLGIIPEKIDRNHCKPCIDCGKMFTSYSGRTRCLGCREKCLGFSKGDRRVLCSNEDCPS